jgi:hypothetical protein
MKFLEDITLRSIKILNIGWATVAYFAMAIITIFILDKVYGKFDTNRYEKMSLFDLNKSVILYVWLIGVITYFIRNLFPLVPFPFDGFMGYDHNKVKEVTSAATFGVFVVLFNERLQGYYSIIKKRMFNF